MHRTSRRQLSVALLSFLVVLPAAAIPDRVAERDTDPKYRAGEVVLLLDATAGARARGRLDAELRVEGARTGVASLDAIGAAYQVTRIEPVFRYRHSLAEEPGGDPRLMNFHVVRFAAAADVLEVAEAYAADPNVLRASPNIVYEPDACVIPNDPRYPEQYAHQQTSACEAWDYELGDPEVIIATIGTGVRMDHEDFQTAPSKFRSPYDFQGMDTDPSPEPLEEERPWHETTVSGVAAAVANNGLGIAGVCWRCSLMPLRVDYSETQVADAVDWAGLNNAKIVNMSFSRTDGRWAENGPTHVAIQTYAGSVAFVASAGNRWTETENYPAALPEVIGVAALKDADEPALPQRAIYSNFGPWVSVAAPGDGIVTTSWNPAQPANLSLYETRNGTSLAAPYVAGTLGLMFSRTPGLSVADARFILEYTATHVGHVWTEYFTGGQVNVLDAVLADGVRPNPVAVIKSPQPHDLMVEAGNVVSLWGTAVGGSYLVQVSRRGSGVWTTLATGPAPGENQPLATWDTTGLVRDWYDLRLRVFTGNVVTSHQVDVYVHEDDYFLDGWPLSIPSTNEFVLAVDWSTSPVVWDLDGVGGPELIVADRDNGAGTRAGLHVFDASGAYFPGAWPRSAPWDASEFHGAASVGNIDSIMGPEIVIGTDTGYALAAYKPDGTPVAHFPVMSLDTFGAPALANLDTDPELEIVLGAFDAGSFSGAIQAFDGSGSRIFNVPLTFMAHDSPAVGDVDGDGKADIVVREFNRLHVIGADGQPLGGSGPSAPWPEYWCCDLAAPILVDVHPSPGHEILAKGAFSVRLYDHQGNTLQTWSLPAPDSRLGAGDLDGDGIPEGLVVDENDLIHVLDLDDGGELAGWPVFAGSYRYHERGVGEAGFGLGPAAPILADVTGDGAPELIVHSRDHHVKAYQPNGSEVPGWELFHGGRSWNSPIVTDFDCDGDADLIVADADPPYSRIAVYDLDTAWQPGATEWATYQATPRHDGVYVGPNPPDASDWLDSCP